jgi:hypothetical protein
VALALLAHPDDAEILCAGTLIRLADAGWQIHIARRQRVTVAPQHYLHKKLHAFGAKR